MLPGVTAGLPVVLSCRARPCLQGVFRSAPQVGTVWCASRMVSVARLVTATAVERSCCGNPPAVRRRTLVGPRFLACTRVALSCHQVLIP